MHSREYGPFADKDLNLAYQKPEFKRVSCTINGIKVEKMVDKRASLTDFLRNDFGLTSVKKGCEVGECGACSVLIDGNSVDSCLYLAIWADGKDIWTTEGLQASDGSLSLIQQAFIDHAAVQCGFCTPGFIITATEIVQRATRYNRDELKVLLAGNMCRCTGYENILRAVEDAIEMEISARGEIETELPVDPDNDYHDPKIKD